MTNHPRSQRPKFKVGQAVVGKLDGFRAAIVSRSFIDEEWNYEVALVRFRWENELRPLTKKEAGR